MNTHIYCSFIASLLFINVTLTSVDEIYCSFITSLLFINVTLTSVDKI